MPLFTSTTPLLGGAFPFELLLLTIAICTVIALTVFALGKRRKIPKNLRGKNVLITGGGSGIGRKQAILFAKQGCSVIICDLRQEFLEKVAKEIEEMHQQSAVEEKKKHVAESDASASTEEHHRPRVYTFVCDVSDRHKVYALATKVKAEVGTVDILVNNAGIVIGKPFLELSDEQLLRTMDVNSLAHFWTLRAFLPEMIERDSGHIVTVASIAGLFGAPHLADYSASKFAVVGLHESIRLELRKLKKKGVKMTLVAPSPINTGFFDGFKTSLGIPLLDENHVASAIVEGVLYERQVLVLPQFIEYAYILLRMMPVDWRDTISEMMGTHHCMNSFKGRGIDFAMKKLEQSCAEPSLSAENVK